MRLELKRYDDLGRSMYVIYPDGERRVCYENTMITILRENDSDADIRALLESEEFCKLANYHRLVMLFPNPVNGHWNWELDENGENDLYVVTEMARRFPLNPDMRDHGVWHCMPNCRYFLGIGEGGSMLHTLAAVAPVGVAGIFTVGGKIAPKAIEGCIGSPVSAMCVEADTDAVEFLKKLNRTDVMNEAGAFSTLNPAQFVKTMDVAPAKDLASLITCGWENVFSQVYRSNASELGDMDFRYVREEGKFVVHENDPMLGDNGGLPHTWFEYVPKCVKENPDKKVPLLIFNHGGSDNPAECSNMVKMEAVAEEEGFLVVYPWSSEKWGWNMDMLDSQYDDMAYLEALIDHMKATYAVDETRVYMGGFSNGSAMCQAFAMTHPETIAAICPDNTRFCQDRNTKAFAIAGMKKLSYDYRMPVWYTYSTRDFEYPAVRGSGQQVAYDFWKRYNNITVKETPYVADPCGVGVPGDKIEVSYPNPRFPERKYTTHRFFSNDPTPLNLYNCTLADGKAHDCNPEEAWMEWNYVKQFRRMADGSLVIEK